VLNLAVGVLRDEQGGMVVVRNSGTRAFMQPGGKIDAGETAAQALQRELYEELGIELDASDFDWLSREHAVAANEPNTHVVAEVFSVGGTQWPAFHLTAEIEEARWLDKHDDVPLASLTKDKIIPLLKWS
jgi:mutator protein MutT